MIWWLMLALVLAGPGKKRTKRKGKQSVSAAPVHPRGTGVDAALLPALTGRTNLLSLEGLQRTSLRFTFEHDGTVLAQLDEATATALRHQLSADPGWRVSQLHGVWLATERVDHGGGWTGGPEGYHLDPTRCSRVAVRLGPISENYPWGGNEQVPRLTTETGEIKVWAYALQREPCRDQRAVALIIEGPGVALEVLDSGDGESMPTVERALSELPIELANAGIDSDRIHSVGFDESQLRSPLPATSASPSLRPLPDGLEYRAAQHFGQAGLSWLRIVRDGVAWEEQVVGEATLESPGWSNDPGDDFALQSRIPIPVSEPFPAVVEIWFRPDGGEPSITWTGTVRVGDPGGR